MFDIVLNSFFAAVPVYLFFALGCYLRYKGTINLKDEKAVLHLTMDIGYPCLIFFNIMKHIAGNPELSSPLFCLEALSCGFLEMLAGVVVAFILAKILRLKIGNGLRSFVVSAGLQNYIFFVIPLLTMLSTGPDDPSMGVLFVHNVGCEIFVWSFAVFLMSGNKSDLSLGVLTRGPLLAVFASLALVWTGAYQYVALPPIMRTTEMIGAVATPLSLVLCGCSIWDIIQKKSWNPKVISLGCVARLILTPMLILLIAWALPVDPIIKRIMVIQSAIPSAVVAVMLARRFGGDPELSMQVVLTTTIFSVLTLPIWLLIGDLYIVTMF